MLTAPRSLAWVSETLPSPGLQEVVVETRVSAISIGSELPLYQGIMSVSHPRRMGYENVGRVVACGPSVQHLRPGDRVVGFYGQRTLALVPEHMLLPVPKDVSDSLALLAILTCDAAKGVRRLAPLPEEIVLITGAGAMGLLTLFILRAYGVMAVDVVEPLVARHALAYKLGARQVLRPEALAERGEIYTLAFECSSRNSAFSLLQEHMGEHGRICITADGNLEPLMLIPAFHKRELQVIGSSDGWDYQKHAAWYFQYVQQHRTHLDLLFEKEILHTELIETFAQLDHGEIQPVKVLVHY
ncbi:MAG TPA: zinc-binding alcohol dehydrogenase [Ktedonobacteraceae bacterium]|nr:zinc-binding alcohol dehydrogenase [Ktedonobacteraceae bacterium]